MSRDNDDLERFVRSLREESAKGPGRGIGRVAALARGGAGLAAKVFSSAKRGAGASLSPRDIKSFEGLARQLGQLKGLPMKMGQIMSYLEIDLPEEARGILGTLQTQSPATPLAAVQDVIREDLGDRAPGLLASMDPIPASIASIGQVHRGVLPDGTRVAIKVRHPHIEAALRSDFRLAGTGTGFARLIMPGLGATAREFWAEIEARLMEECDYRLEAERQKLFGRLCAGHSVIVPEVHDAWCGPRVLTTTWETGREFEEFRAVAGQSERDAAGAILFDFYVGMLYRRGIFHADPHPGNYHFRDDGRVVVFDYGCVREFEPTVTRAFVSLAAAVRDDDRERIGAALTSLGARPSSDDAAYQHLRGLLRSFFQPMLTPGRQRVDAKMVVDMRQIARDKLALAKIRLPGRLMFLFRIRFGLYAVLSRLGSVCDWSAMEKRFAEESGLA